MAFRNVKAFVDAQTTNGSIVTTSFRKTVLGGGAGTWTDLSQGGGSPSANFYASSPLVASRLTSYKGIWSGGDTGTRTKHLSNILLMSPSANLAASTFMLCDYLLYYPFVDMDTDIEQVLDNTVTLNRYTDGVGVQAFLVAQGTYIGGGQYFITYTNEKGQSGRTSQLCISNSATLAGSLISSGNNSTSLSQFGCFIPLQGADKGIRSVQKIQFLTSNGGIAALVLCKPLASVLIREVNTPVEKSFLKDNLSLPRIYDDAYLNFLIYPAAAPTGTFVQGILDFVWN